MPSSRCNSALGYHGCAVYGCSYSDAAFNRILFVFSSSYSFVFTSIFLSACSCMRWIYGRHCFTPDNVGFIEFYSPMSIWRLVTSYYRCVLPTDLWTRPYVDTSCVLAVHDLNTVRAAVALGDTYKHVIPFTNIMLPSHARSPWNRKRYQRSSVSVRLSSSCRPTLRTIRCRVSSPTKVGLFNARSVASSGKSQSISTWVSKLKLTAAGLVETWHDGPDTPALVACAPPGYTCIQSDHGRDLATRWILYQLIMVVCVSFTATSCTLDSSTPRSTRHLNT